MAARSIYGNDVAGYAAGRPDYPDQVYETLRRRCGLRAGSDVLEIGAGTGLVTRRLIDSGARVAVVEPDLQMGEHLRAMLGRGVDVISDTFETANVEEGRFDLVVAATSFHWVDQAVGLAKLARVLRPGGWAALWWTIFDDPDSEDTFREALRQRLGREDPGGQGNVAFQLDRGARQEDLSEVAGLEVVGSELIRWTAELTAAQLRALYGSLISIRELPADEQRQILDEVLRLANEGFSGLVVRAFVTVMYTGRRPQSDSSR
jgi:SAM-dependent methyltransferase